MRRRAWAGRLFVAPNLAAVAVFMLFPLGFSLYMSFQQWDVFTPPKFVGLKNFQELFTSDPLFLIAIRNTVIFTLGTVVPTSPHQPRRRRRAEPESQGHRHLSAPSYFCPWPSRRW